MVFLKNLWKGIFYQEFIRKFHWILTANSWIIKLIDGIPNLVKWDQAVMYWSVFGITMLGSLVMQLVFYSFGVNASIMIAYHIDSCFNGSKVAITQMGKTYSPVLRLCHNTWMSSRQLMGKLLSFSRQWTRCSMVGTFIPNCILICYCPLILH